MILDPSIIETNNPEHKIVKIDTEMTWGLPTMVVVVCSCGSVLREPESAINLILEGRLVFVAGRIYERHVSKSENIVNVQELLKAAEDLRAQITFTGPEETSRAQCLSFADGTVAAAKTYDEKRREYERRMKTS